MPLIYHENLPPDTRIAVWHIKEPEPFFHNKSLPCNISHPHKRLQHLAGRYLLSHLFPEFPFSKILIGENRKPFLQEHPFHFSISHSRDYAAAIVSASKTVGIDIEMPGPLLEKVKHKFLSREESVFVSRLNDHQQLIALSIIWAAKEAIYKWYGKGNLSFTTSMIILPFSIDHKGDIEAVFLRDGEQKNLVLQYRLLNKLTVVWLDH